MKLLTVMSVLSISSTAISSLLLKDIYIDIIKSKLFEIVNDHALDKNCSSDLNSLISDVFTFKRWALEMLDATGKVYPGLFNGNANLIGNYDQCLAITETTKGRVINGQYCSVFLTLDDSGNDSLSRFIKQEVSIVMSKCDNKFCKSLFENLFVVWGLCVPQSCTSKNLEIVAHTVQQEFDLPEKALFLDDLCLYNDKAVKIKSFDFFVYCFFIMIISILTTSTVYDIYSKYFGQIPNVFVVFSMYTNIKQFLWYCRSPHRGPLNCLNGIRVISCIWIVYAHVAQASISASKNPRHVIGQWKSLTMNTFTWTAHYGVDTFFTISGILVVYIYLKYSNKFKIGVLSFTLGRFLRTTPALMAAVLLHTSVTKLLAGGPFGPYITGILSEQCYDKWWRFLIHPLIFSKYSHCAPHIWYMFIDGHLYLCAPIFLFFIRKYPKAVIRTLVIVFILAIIYSYWVTVTKKIGFTVFEWSDDYKNYIYFTTIYHTPSWIIGVLCGYFINKHKFIIPKYVNFFLLAISLFIMVQLIVRQKNLVMDEYNAYRSALWNGLARPTWSLAVSFIIFICATGNGGIINDFLSHPVFRLLSEFTYSIYLLHVDYIVLHFTSMKESFYFTNANIMINFLGVFIRLLFGAIVFYFAFEAPFLSLKTHLLKTEEKQERK